VQKMLEATSRDTVRSTGRTGKPARQLKSEWTDAWQPNPGGHQTLPLPLQNMLAELGQGVLDHSTFFSDTAERLKRTIPPIFRTVYGTEEDNAGTQVRDFHHHVKGDMPGPDGEPVGRYHALDPDTYFWAHATFVEQVLYFADTFVKRLSDAEKEQIYLESKTWYRRYGVSDRPMPAT
ncbi:oxygenase MpaB family protein, partial [Microtetraspora sp. AC03309]|uniref:oxygenase MpaB family protein n=1 Tax=Microtetraspora sp. AC03309 TaxID=2779376 RepID=UPI001E375A15